MCFLLLIAWLTGAVYSNITDFLECYFGLHDSTSIKHVTVKKIQEFWARRKAWTLSNETALDRYFTNIRKHSGADLLPIDLMLDAKMSQVAVRGGCASGYCWRGVVISRAISEFHQSSALTLSLFTLPSAGLEWYTSHYQLCCPCWLSDFIQFFSVTLVHFSDQRWNFQNYLFNLHII